MGVLNIDKAVLQVIARQGSGTWYVIDRALSRQGLVNHESVAQVAQMLAERGLIRIEPKLPGLPSYSITEKGRRFLSRSDKR